MLPTELPIIRYRLTFQVTTPFALPEYAGSALRGAFGRALRKISCMTKQAECHGCWLYQTCPYTNIFETPAPNDHPLQKFSQVPNAYVIEPLEWGEQCYSKGDIFAFDLVLFGRTLEQLPLILFAFKRALEFNLVGGKATLTDFAKIAENQTAFSLFQQEKIREHSQMLSVPSDLPSSLKLEFITPLRIQENGKPLREKEINKTRLLITLAKRISLLAEFHAQQLHLDFEQLITEIEPIQESKQLQWQDWTRYSSRQKQKMKLGGVVGHWQLDNVPVNWAKLLYLGQWLHCGKNATFGLGKYRITNL
ncbi:CRISPR system precrRNA processing endoribonuclease RAMP protein Cas6 [Mannheimia pernigra]|uniref:CRISPR system precrRNA processing endoribonuclease RAMP protein Cas6 n=1 Tax=Mannheimia pernigra TaxID=111844 RepID=A0A7D5HRV1_9PAST|nr:CRISPR system precrRNA processing endoribonuclease RAMP protein Cas6 [Mannheimia pernigra]QLB39772.1 CRISPR system precrRNA processing endoribonuclease RAMP protein Cas6 [Mannheimia pernigra]QLB41734.1 CRISPR system precrRNA processing endoribonuclease RAMP protein Cas6 [Mannheimia pernigra]